MSWLALKNATSRRERGDRPQIAPRVEPAERGDGGKQEIA
jgi:hypothetical protein